MLDWTSISITGLLILTASLMVSNAGGFRSTYPYNLHIGSHLSLSSWTAIIGLEFSPFPLYPSSTTHGTIWFKIPDQKTHYRWRAQTINFTECTRNSSIQDTSKIWDQAITCYPHRIKWLNYKTFVVKEIMKTIGRPRLPLVVK
jgi:hypothetical protein